MNRPPQPNPHGSAERDSGAQQPNPSESGPHRQPESSHDAPTGNAARPDPRGDAPDPDKPVDRADSDPSGDSPQPEQAAAAPEASEPETRDEQMERLRREVEQANKHALQAQADAENFRKRMRRDLEEQLRFAAVPLVSDLLQVRDNLFRALEAASANSGGTSDGLRDGVAMCAKQLDDVLSKHGVREIPAENETFDPNVHEAISQLPSESHPAGTIVHVAVAGFRLHDRVIRPSQVVVSSGSADANSDS